MGVFQTMSTEHSCNKIVMNTERSWVRTSTCWWASWLVWSHHKIISRCFLFCNQTLFAVFYKDSITRHQLYDRNMVSHHVNTWSRGLWWCSTSVCSNAALQVRSTVPLNFSQVKTNSVNVGKEKSPKQSCYYSTRIITRCYTHKKKSGIKIKNIGNRTIFFHGRECNLDMY